MLCFTSHLYSIRAHKKIELWKVLRYYQTQPRHHILAEIEFPIETSKKTQPCHFSVELSKRIPPISRYFKLELTRENLRLMVIQGVERIL
jgi:hypothetical protein